MLLPRIFGPIFGLSALLSAASLMQSTPASACSCMFPTVEAAREDASAVFEGRVLAIKALPGDAGASDGKTQVTFAVVRTWKGLDREEQVDIVTNSSGALCGYTFASDTSYLVYTEGQAGALAVNACSRTRPIADAAEDLAVLGAGATPVAPKTLETKAVADAGSSSPVKPARSGGCASARGQASLVTPWLLAVPAIVLAGRRKRRDPG